MNDHFRDLWAKRGKGYTSEDAAAAVLPPPPEGFRNAYHFTKADHAISSILFGRLKVSRLLELNDPFELLGMNLKHPGDRMRVEVEKEAQNRKVGMVCFSEDYLDPLLWSHYAERHQGIALGFHLDQTRAFEVEYVKKRAENFERKPIGQVDQLLQYVLFTTKYESWAYEREWRVLTPLKDSISEGRLFFWPMSDRMRLTEVVLGPLCPLPVDRVRDVVNKHHTGVVTYKARPAHGFFGVVPDENTVPPYPITPSS